MRIVLSNRELTFLRLLHSGRIPTITIIARYMISEFDDARCIVADLKPRFKSYMHTYL